MLQLLKKKKIESLKLRLVRLDQKLRNALPAPLSQLEGIESLSAPPQLQGSEPFETPKMKTPVK